MKQKKYYKTWKFWVTSLLALSASSIITSLTLTSCAANSTVNKDDIVINEQSQDQEFSVDDNKDLTLSVNATSNSGANLRYQWYVNKTSDNSSWQKIQGATSSTYTIPISEIENIDQETTWRYKADVYHENNESIKTESKPIPVKIKPPVGGSVPEEPSIPETKPDQPTPPTPTPPSNPDLNPDQPSNPTEPTPPNQQPGKPDTPNDPDNPTIQPAPGHKPSVGIGARLPLDETGIVTTKYDQEKWIGDNSISMMIEAKPNVQGIREAVNRFNDSTSDINIKRMLNSLVGTLNGASNYSYNQFGTGWILDYSNNTNNTRITDYYIATNMHVLNSYYEITYESTRYNNSYEDPITVGVRIPFNKTTISSLDVYISQPTYDTSDHKNNLKAYADKLSSQWYKTNINVNNWDESLVPLGAYNSNEGTNGFEYSQPFDMELTWEYKYNSRVRQTLYFKSDNKGNYLTSSPVYDNSSFQSNIDDFSVLKIELKDDAFDNRIKAGDQYSKMFASMKELFNISSTSDVNEKSSYIKKLNKLLSMTSTQNAYDKALVDKLFMFSDLEKITNLDTQISIGGYPLLKELVPDGKGSYKWQSYTTFNTNTLTGNNIIEYPERYYPSRDKMGINQYTYKGKIYKIWWKGPGNFVLKNVNLLAGSSGGVAIDQNYKISCINWGSYIHIEYHDGIKYVLDSSTSTGLYSKTDKSSLVWKWMTYLGKNNKKTKLSQLFEQLQTRGYFK